MSSDCLRAVHLSVYHIQNQIYDLSVVFESHQRFHLLGLSETRLKNHIPGEGLSLPHYSLIERMLPDLSTVMWSLMSSDVGLTC